MRAENSHFRRAGRERRRGTDRNSDGETGGVDSSVLAEVGTREHTRPRKMAKRSTHPIPHPLRCFWRAESERPPPPLAFAFPFVFPVVAFRARRLWSLFMAPCRHDLNCSARSLVR
jgi:hypothetical protein